MANEYDWIDRRDACKRDFSFKDMLLGWTIYFITVLCLIL